MGPNLNKLENPERIAELNPEKTLKKAGLEGNSVLIDIGAGSGVFTIPAAKITSGMVYALDINSRLLEIIDDKAKSEGLNNVTTMKVANGQYDIAENTADFVLLITVLHEIPDKGSLFKEIKRVIKDTGKIVIIEFNKKQTTIGPPASLRLDEEEVITICSKHGFKVSDEFDLSDNLYCIVFDQ
ncbi:MAG: class I SAM-dependent methyltransferase [Clostridiaceae bacterium]